MDCVDILSPVETVQEITILKVLPIYREFQWTAQVDAIAKQLDGIAESEAHLILLITPGWPFLIADGALKNRGIVEGTASLFLTLFPTQGLPRSGGLMEELLRSIVYLKQQRFTAI